jgi:D-alanyl-D-alanine carboxypeptidase/D-alanyl-D-alanine-endopeptidase (penicillin-binding protein 4)
MPGQLLTFAGVSRNCMRQIIFSLLCIFTLASCATAHLTARRFSRTIQREVTNSAVFQKVFTGFVLVDPVSGKTLADVNGEHYFTPASNTKILTLYTCLKVLGDSMPGIVWSQNERSVTLVPVGDPTFLHPLFQTWQPVMADLLHVPPDQAIIVDTGNYSIQPLGPGWAWDDVDSDYSAERTGFPMYGNTKRLFAAGSDSLDIEPGYWKSRLLRSDRGSADNPMPVRQFRDNTVAYDSALPLDSAFETWLPVRESAAYLHHLLEDTLHREVSWGTGQDRIGTIRYSCPVDTVYRRMMHQSDNFIAEQLLLAASGVRTNFSRLNQDSVIRWMLDSVWNDLPQRPRWVDGSGLSRYNLVSPRDLSVVLKKLWDEQPRERLFSLFPAGGISGTIADLYPGKNGKPYVFAKTGSMSGVYCLSGFVQTGSGKVLIFSFMHNNFIGSNKPLKSEMQRILEFIRDNY